MPAGNLFASLKKSLGGDAVMRNLRYFTKIDQIPIDETEKEKLKKVTEKFAFRINEYYLNLINWDDPNDPIRRIIIPSMDELIEWGELDASNEHKYTVAPGLEHKYKDTALMLVSRVCGGICRFCFRKRVFLAGNKEIMIDVEPGLEYIKKHKEITNVLLSGGDPLMLSTSKLESIISRLREIDHVQIIRLERRWLLSTLIGLSTIQSSSNYSKNTVLPKNVSR